MWNFKHRCWAVSELPSSSAKRQRSQLDGGVSTALMLKSQAAEGANIPVGPGKTIRRVLQPQHRRLLDI